MGGKKGEIDVGGGRKLGLKDEDIVDGDQC